MLICHAGGQALPKYARSAIGLAQEKGWHVGKNPIELFILAWVLRHFLPRKSGKQGNHFVAGFPTCTPMAEPVTLRIVRTLSGTPLVRPSYSGLTVV